MKVLTKVGLAALFFIACHLTLTAVVYAGAGNVGAEFLAIGIGARAESMGGAFTGLADDVSAGYWNPGGLAQLEGMQVLTMYNSWFEGMTHVYLGLGKKLDSGSVIGGEVNYMTSGDISGADTTGNAASSFSGNWMAVGLSYSGYVGENVGVGVNLKNVTESISGESGTGMGADLGLIYKYGEKGDVGLSVLNLGSGIQYAGDTEASPFPQIVRAGISYNALEGENSLVLCFDVANYSMDTSMGIGAGGEYRTAGGLALRAGAEQVDGVMTPTFGIGIGGNGNFIVDIGAGMYSSLGSAYKVSLLGKFGGTGEGAKVKSSSSKSSVVKESKAGGALDSQYKEAMAAGDYDKAMVLKKKIEAQKLDNEYKGAMAAGDYDKAIELKKKMQELESK